MSANEISATPSSHESAPTGSALERAIAHLRTGLRGDGTYEGVGEWDVVDHQWRLLDEWAGAEQLRLPLTLLPAHLGGREHDVLFDEASERWIKFTKESGAGYAVELVAGRLIMLPATPLQYLERWRVHNSLFFDDVKLVGLRSEGYNHRIVISQRDCGAETPAWNAIEQAMVEDYGLARLSIDQQLGGYDARAYLSGRYAVFDVRPANCARSPRGIIMPFDVICQVFSLADVIELREML